MKDYNFIPDDFNPMDSYGFNDYEIKDEFDFKGKEEAEHEDFSSRAILNLLRKNPK